MTPTQPILDCADKLHDLLLQIRGGTRLDHWDRGRLAALTTRLIWHLCHDPAYLASDPDRDLATQYYLDGSS